MIGVFKKIWDLAGTEQKNIRNSILLGFVNQNSLGQLIAVATTTLIDVENAAPVVLVTSLGGFLNSLVFSLAIFLFDWRIGLIVAAGVILLTKTATADQIADKLQEFGVLVLGKPFTGAQFRQAVQLAASNYKRLAVLRAENAKLLDKIAQLRLVDRAKCYLIEKKHYTETEAHRLIEKMAMDTRRPRGEIAQEILEEDDEE